MFRSVTRFIARSRLAAQIARERQELRSLDTRALRDLGIDALAAQQEAARGYWDLPRERQQSLSTPPAGQGAERQMTAMVEPAEIPALHVRPRVSTPPTYSAPAVCAA